MTHPDTEKLNWNDAPEWAEWLAQDARGGWYWYKNKPFINEDINMWNVNDPNWQRVNWCEPNPNWRNTLESRSEPQVPNEETRAECTPEERKFLDLVKHASMVKAAEAGQTAKVFFCDWGEESNGNQFLSYLYRVRANT